MPDYKILIADYEPRGIQQLRDPLADAGYIVEVVKDGLKAIEAFNALKPDLTLIEAMLPKKHGFEVCEELKKTQHGSVSPIVIVTSVYKGRKYRTQALHHYRCDEYLEKPISADKLLETVHRLIGNSKAGAAATPSPAAGHASKPAAGHASKPTPSSRPAGMTRVDGGGEAEVEIMERLDEIMGSGKPAHSSKFGKR